MNKLLPTLLALPLLGAPAFAAAQTDGDAAPVDAAPVDAATDATPMAYGDGAADTGMATDEAVEEEDGDEPNLFIGLKAGILAPQLVNELGLNALVTLEAGYFLPFAGRRLSVNFEATYAPPGVNGSQSDPRIGTGGGNVKWDQTTHETSLALGLQARFMPPTSFISPYVTAMGRVYMMKTHMTGSAGGETFGVNDEVSTRVGITGVLGADMELGPGRLLLEIGSGWSQLHHITTGSTSTTALTVQLGYRILL